MNLLEKIKNNTLTPEGTPTYKQAVVAMADLQALDGLAGLDAKAKTAAREELTQVIASYRRTLKTKRWLRKKRTRG